MADNRSKNFFSRKRPTVGLSAVCVAFWSFCSMRRIHPVWTMLVVQRWVPTGELSHYWFSFSESIETSCWTQSKARWDFFLVRSFLSLPDTGRARRTQGSPSSSFEVDSISPWFRPTSSWEIDGATFWKFSGQPVLLERGIVRRLWSVYSVSTQLFQIKLIISFSLIGSTIREWHKNFVRYLGTMLDSAVCVGGLLSDKRTFRVCLLSFWPEGPVLWAWLFRQA